MQSNEKSFDDCTELGASCLKCGSFAHCSTITVNFEPPPPPTY